MRNPVYIRHAHISCYCACYWLILMYMRHQGIIWEQDCQAGAMPLIAINFQQTNTCYMFLTDSMQDTSFAECSLSAACSTECERVRNGLIQEAVREGLSNSQCLGRGGFWPAGGVHGGRETAASRHTWRCLQDTELTTQQCTVTSK